MRSKVYNLNNESIEKMRMFMRNGEPIKGIKHIQEKLGCGLAEAKREYEIFIGQECQGRN